ncbi:MAG: hypothetical protein ACI3ZD_04925 [Prevotella sp.]
MKKLITLFAAAIMAVGANAQTEELWVSSGNPGWYQATVANVSTLENFHIDFRSKWSVYQLVDDTNPITLADYKGVKIEYTIDTSSTIAINLNVAGEQYSELPADQSSVIILFDKDDKLSELTEVKDMSLQQADAGKASIDVKSISLVKIDDSEVQFTTCGTKCYNNTAYKSCTLKFAGWGSQGLLRNDNGEDLTFDPASGLSYKYEIKFAEAITFDVALSLNYKDGDADKSVEFIAASGATELVATVNSENCTQSIVSTGIKGFSDQSIKIASVKRTTIDPTGVQKIEVLNPANAEFVNAAGQKVGKNYKGLVINKATGKKFINK